MNAHTCPVCARNLCVKRKRQTCGRAVCIRIASESIRKARWLSSPSARRLGQGVRGGIGGGMNRPWRPLTQAISVTS